jgi:Bacteriophage Mu Gp45 spike protein
MHRISPVASAFRAYSAGGARSVVDKVNDGTLMQEMKGKFMAGESREKFEAPQNYGFSSVVQPVTGEGDQRQGSEAFISFIGGNRSFPVAAMMDDRRFRPMGLKPGENSQYDDLGQMTLIRRTGTYMLSLDSEDQSQQQSGGGKAGDSSGGSGGQGKKVERMVSLRHVEKKKQDRQKSQGKASPGTRAVAAYPMSSDMTNEQRIATIAKQLALRARLQEEEDRAAEADSKSKEDFKHEGETVNTEVRCTKGRIEFRTGDKVVGYYDVKDDTWYFTAKLIHNKATSEVKDEAPKINHN